MFEGIFVRYKDERIGCWVRDLKGKYHFSRDVEFDEDTPGKLSSKCRMMDPPSDISSDDSPPVPSPLDMSLPNSSPPDTRPSRAIKSTEKSTEWQAQLLCTCEKARLQRQTPAGKAAVDAAALLTAHAVAPADKYFSLESLDSLMTTSYPTVFLTQSFPYRSSAPC
ncbi:hypothetical protein EDD85DRAFT_962789 [Armillaria nabsnona]|nr:hypothetical protein EDD85DRAFT_962789 [Armillaria nabsnona]